LDSFRPLPPDLVRSLDEWFKIELTYTSNALEGNTLSRAETALVVEKGLTVNGKTLREHLEAVNHAAALDWLGKLVGQPRQAISERTILDLHALVLQRIADANAGRYRSVAVRMAGSMVVLPNAQKVPRLMSDLIEWLQQAAGNPLAIAAEAHYRLVSIHPFVDGNGRTARLLMNLLLMQSGYPPAIIRKEDRLQYINSLEAGRLDESLEAYYSLVFEAVERSLDIYLAALGAAQEDRAPAADEAQLLKIGQLSRLTGETAPTLRYWTREGLLTTAGTTPGGYQLYHPHMAQVAAEIRRLQVQERRTIAEIRQILEEKRAKIES
jgi:Fic family protein